MGTDIKEHSSAIDELTDNMASDFIAELFVEELEFLLDEQILNRIIVKNHGMNTRANSKDILQVSSDFISKLDHSFEENIVIHLSRNSIYHQLPEIFFFPLSLDVKSNSKKEVVSAIRSNREKEKGNIEFFSLFDTEIFKEKVKINNRSLNFFSDKKSKQNLLDIFKQIIGEDLHLTDRSFYKLFLNICNSELYKEDLPKLEELVKVVLNLNVKINYKSCTIDNTPFANLGIATLGIDFGLGGAFYSEVDDIEVVILLDDYIDDYKIIEKNIILIKEVLRFFLVSSRKIYVTYQTNSIEPSFVLSNRYLGYDSYLNK